MKVSAAPGTMLVDALLAGTPKSSTPSRPTGTPDHPGRRRSRRPCSYEPGQLRRGTVARDVRDVLRHRHGARQGGSARQRVLKGVSLEVPEGAFRAVLVGPERVPGKSTPAARLLAGLEQADGGSIPLRRSRRGDRASSRAIATSPWSSSRTRSTRTSPCAKNGVSPSASSCARPTPPRSPGRVAEAATMQLGLTPLLDRLPRMLSGGRRQRAQSPHGARHRCGGRSSSSSTSRSPTSTAPPSARRSASTSASSTIQLGRHQRLRHPRSGRGHDPGRRALFDVLDKGVVEQAGAPLRDRLRAPGHALRAAPASWACPR